MSRFPSAAFLCSFLTIVVLRVVGGSNALEGQFPHQVSLRMNGTHICSGSIISPNYVLTTAHCAGNKDKYGVYKPTDPRTLTILAGTNKLLGGGVVRQVASVKVHEEYIGVKNDVATMKLAAPLNLSRKIQPIGLPSDETPADTPVLISGWGSPRSNGESPIDLQWNVLFTKGNCFGQDELICMTRSTGIGACNGDPAVSYGKLVGLAGFEVRVCGSVNPDGFANIFHHVDWIRKHSDL